MIRLQKISRLFAGLLVSAVACGGSSSSSPGDDTFGGDPLMRMTSASGALRVDVRTSPSQPPSRGEQAVELTLTDPASGAPRTGLKLSAIAWMPAMGHGASVTPSVTESAPGTYVVRDVDLFMPGTWELRTTIAGDSTDHVAPSFQIP